MEHLRCLGEDEIEKCTNTWESYTEFKNTRKYGEYRREIGEKDRGE